MNCTREWLVDSSAELRRFWFQRRVGCVLASALAGGCGGLNPELGGAPEEEVSTIGADLATAFGNKADGTDSDARYTTPWASPGTVNVCYVGPDTGAGDDDTPEATRMATAHAAVVETWGAASGLTFVNRGKCPATIPTAYISVFIAESASNGSSWAGVGSRMDADPRWDNRTNIQTYFGDRAGEYRRQVVHEFGHALGFYHELERADVTNDGCGTVGVGNVNGRITAYDRDSIMTWTYCTSVRSEESPLSPLDQLGVEMMYPKRLTGHKLACAAGCVESGTGAIVRTNGSVTTDWLRRGATLSLFNPVWTFGGSSVVFSNGRLAAADLSAASTSVAMDFPKAFDVLNIPPAQQSARLTGGGTIVKSDALHTAVLMGAVL